MITVNGRLQDALALASSAGSKLSAICFSCNGSVKRVAGVVSTAILGVGTGRWADRMYDSLGKKLGELIATNSKNCRVYVLQRATLNYSLVAVKTKDAWQEQATLDNVRECLRQLVSMTDQQGWTGVVLPIFGTGSGKLSKNDILPLMIEMLDDRFIVVNLLEENDNRITTF